MHSDLTDLHKLRRLLGLADNAGVGDMLGAVDRLLMQAGHRKVYEPELAAATARDEGWARQIRVHIETEHEVALDPDLAAVIEEHVAAALARARQEGATCYRCSGAVEEDRLRVLCSSCAEKVGNRVMSELANRKRESAEEIRKIALAPFIAAGLAGEDGQPIVKGVLGKPPITKDGYLIGDGAYCWFIMPGAKGKDDDRPARVMYKPMPITDPDAYGGTRKVYSSSQAAQAAAAVPPIGVPEGACTSCPESCECTKVCNLAAAAEREGGKSE